MFGFTGTPIFSENAVKNEHGKRTTKELFDDGELGMDLIAINIQRGRDHGLPVYLLYRHACGTAGGGTITEFDQLSTNISPAVSTLYYVHTVTNCFNY